MYTFYDKNENLFGKYMKNLGTQEKVSNIIKIAFTSELIDNKKYIKTGKKST